MAKRVLDLQDIRARLQGLRKWLSPPDREWNYMVLDRVDFTTTRYPGTCNWFRPSLRSFVDSIDDNIMVVIGAPGVGKSTLSGWILDEFETELDKKDRCTLYFHIRKSYSENMLIR
jgi:Cdc6-like AAA superfamily ATPase